MSGPIGNNKLQVEESPSQVVADAKDREIQQLKSMLAGRDVTIQELNNQVTILRNQNPASVARAVAAQMNQRAAVGNQRAAAQNAQEIELHRNYHTIARNCSACAEVVSCVGMLAAAICGLAYVVFRVTVG